ncbi:MAG: ankyrin repeat domain-containing protein, partial [Chlamydiia bacterium]|nr:ankyrin repeat domain-containing protein [Chlamydiia bacterium]
RMLALILGRVIGKELEDVQETIKCKHSVAHLNTIKAKVKKLTSVETQKLTPLCKAAYEGDLETFSTLFARDPLAYRELDTEGRGPIHYAILGNQIAIFDKLIESGLNVDTPNREGDSLVHFAAAADAQTILSKLVALKADLNHQNTGGMTALHYAAANEKMSTVELLIKGNADHRLCDSDGISPLALIGVCAHQRDPLALSKTQVIMFAMSSVAWLSVLAINMNWVSKDQSRTLQLLSAGATIAFECSALAALVEQLDKNWKIAIAGIAQLGLRAIPPFHVGFSAWQLYQVAQSSFQGLKACWNNLGYRNWAVMCNTAVHAGNTAFSTLNLYNQAISAHEKYKKWKGSSHLPKGPTAQTPPQPENKTLKNRLSIDDKVKLIDKCGNRNPNIQKIKGLKPEERISYRDLIASCPKHALLMISPDLTLEQLCEKGTTLYEPILEELRELFQPIMGSPQFSRNQKILEKLMDAENIIYKWNEQTQCGKLVEETVRK